MKIYRYLVLLLIILITFGQFGRIPLGESTVSIYLNDLLLPLILGLWLVDVIKRGGKFKLPYLTAPVVLFSGIGVLSLIWGSTYVKTQELFVSSLYLIRWIMYVGIYFVVYDLIKQKDKKEREQETNFLITLILNVGFVIAFLGLVQYALFPDFSAMVAHGWDPHYYRVLSTFFDPNYVGAFFVLNLTLVLTMSLEVDSWKKLDLKKAIMGIVLLLAIIFTFSRSTYLIFIVSMGVVGLFRSWKLILLGVLVGILSFVFIPRVQERIIGGFVNIDDSASFRFQSWEKGLEIGAKNPIIGVGFNTYRYAQIRYDLVQPWDEGEVLSHAGAGVDSSLLLVFATTGVLGVIAYLWFLFRQALLGGMSFFKAKSQWSKVLGLTVLAAVCGLLIHSQFVNSLFYPFILEWMMIVLGIMEGNWESA